mgnify:CR=1 FL=1
MYTGKRQKPRTDHIGMIIYLFVASVIFIDCPKLGKAGATGGACSPADLVVINDSLKYYRFIRQHYIDSNSKINTGFFLLGRFADAVLQ